MIHAEQKTAEGIATLCDAQEADIEPIIDYWYSSTEDYLADMGVDRRRLGTPEQARLRYMRALRNGNPVNFAISAAASAPNPGAALMPVPTAVPPSARRYTPFNASWIRSRLSASMP